MLLFCFWGFPTHILTQAEMHPERLEVGSHTTACRVSGLRGRTGKSHGA